MGHYMEKLSCSSSDISLPDPLPLRDKIIKDNSVLRVSLAVIVVIEDAPQPLNGLDIAPHFSADSVLHLQCRYRPRGSCGMPSGNIPPTLSCRRGSTVRCRKTHRATVVSLPSPFQCSEQDRQHPRNLPIATFLARASVPASSYVPSS